MRNVPIAIFGGDSLFREGLKSVLARTEFKPVVTAPNIPQAKHRSAAQEIPQLIVFRDDCDENSQNLLRASRSQYSAARTVVLVGSPSRHHFGKCIDAGVDGYLDINVAPSVLVGALRLVLGGAQVFPTASVADLLKSETQYSKNERPLSPREHEIVGLLAQGASNKAIARQLDLKDTTVKVHVRKILHKIGVSNRTQAAIWASQNGFKTSPSAPVGRSKHRGAKHDVNLIEVDELEVMA